MYMDTGSNWLYMIYVYVVHLNSFPVIEFAQYDIFALYPIIATSGYMYSSMLVSSSIFRQNICIDPDRGDIHA